MKSIMKMFDADHERAFQLALARSFERYGHSAYLTDVPVRWWSKRFYSDQKIKPDILVLTSSRWSAHESLPVIAIEAKNDADLYSYNRGVEHVCRLIEQGVRYSIQKGGEWHLPSIYLLATPFSVKHGVLCRQKDIGQWDDSLVSSGIVKECALREPRSNGYFTERLDSYLTSIGAAILRSKGEFTDPDSYGLSLSDRWYLSLRSDK